MQNMTVGFVTGTDENAPEPAVWVVDDTPAVRLMAAHAFARAGWKVTEFEDLVTALSALATRPAPAAVILDIHLPDGCGLDNVREFTMAGSAVVVVSNLVGPEQVERAFAAGAVDIVTKPVDMRILLARVERSVRLGTTTAAPTSDFTSRLTDPQPSPVAAGLEP